jgi:hypothetical protein
MTTSRHSPSSRAWRLLVEHDERALQLLCAKYPQYWAQPPPGPFVVVEIDERIEWSVGAAL